MNQDERMGEAVAFPRRHDEDGSIVAMVSYGQGQSDHFVVKKGSTGYRRCGVSFNPSEHPHVRSIKALSALLMDHIEALEHSGEYSGRPNAVNAFENAKDELEKAQMLAVKALFVDSR